MIHRLFFFFLKDYKSVQALISRNMVIQMAKRNLHFHSCYFETYFLCELLIMKARWKDMFYVFIHSYKYMWVIYRIEEDLCLHHSLLTCLQAASFLFDCALQLYPCNLECCPSHNWFMERFPFFSLFWVRPLVVKGKAGTVPLSALTKPFHTHLCYVNRLFVFLFFSSQILN